MGRTESLSQRRRRFVQEGWLDRLTPTQKDVWQVYEAFEEDGVSCPGAATIAKCIGHTHVDHIRTTRRELCKLGLLELISVGCGTEPSKYRVCVPAPSAKDGTEGTELEGRGGDRIGGEGTSSEGREGTKLDGKGGDETGCRSPLPAHPSPNLSPTPPLLDPTLPTQPQSSANAELRSTLFEDGSEERPIEPTQKPSAKSARKRPGVDADLERIYQAYPRHEAKGTAFRAIRKALVTIARRAGIRDPAEWLLERVKAYAATRAPKDQFTPMPASWFNAERFDDDPSEWSRGDNHASTSKRPRTAAQRGEYPEQLEVKVLDVGH